MIPADNFLRPRGQLTNQFFLFTCGRKTSQKLLASLHLWKQQTSLLTSDRAEAKLASEPRPGRHTVDYGVRWGSTYKRAWHNQSLLRICPGFFQRQTRTARQAGTDLMSAMSYNCRSGSHIWAVCELWDAHVGHLVVWLRSGSKESNMCVSGCRQDQTFWLVNQ